jgi:hypothetical protein
VLYFFRLDLVVFNMLVFHFMFIGHLFLLLWNLWEKTKVFEEIALQAVLSKHFEDADHSVVPVVDHIVELRSIRIGNHASHCILAKDLMLVFNDFWKVYLTISIIVFLIVFMRRYFKLVLLVLIVMILIDLGIVTPIIRLAIFIFELRSSLKFQKAHSTRRLIGWGIFLVFR